MFRNCFRIVFPSEAETTSIVIKANSQIVKCTMCEVCCLFSV